jgi:hypothetical protein
MKAEIEFWSPALEANELKSQRIYQNSSHIEILFFSF